MVAVLKEEVQAMKLAEKSEKAGRLADNLGRLTDQLDGRSRRITINVETVLRAIRQNSEQLGQILERLHNRPSDLIFGDPSPQDESR